MASLTSHESILASNRQLRRLRHASFGLVILLVIQYILGLANNLYGTAPTATRDITEFSSPLLAVHVINGTLLVIAAAWLVVVTVRARARLAMITSGIGLLSVLAAFYGGESFIHKGGASGYSMLMGVMMAVALLCYIINVWAFDGRVSNQGGAEMTGHGAGSTAGQPPETAGRPPLPGKPTPAADSRPGPARAKLRHTPRQGCAASASTVRRPGIYKEQ